jgi:hypothetical protein
MTNSPLVDMLYYSDTLFWMQSIQFLLLLFNTTTYIAANANFIVFGLTWLGLELKIYNDAVVVHVLNTKFKYTYTNKKHKITINNRIYKIFITCYAPYLALSTIRTHNISGDRH